MNHFVSMSLQRRKGSLNGSGEWFIDRAARDAVSVRLGNDYDTTNNQVPDQRFEYCHPATRPSTSAVDKTRAVLSEQWKTSTDVPFAEVSSVSCGADRRRLSCLLAFAFRTGQRRLPKLGRAPQAMSFVGGENWGKAVAPPNHSVETRGHPGWGPTTSRQNRRRDLSLQRA